VATPGIIRRNELTSSDYICVQCIELKNQLKETVDELKSARLITELLRQQSFTKITSNQGDINRSNISHLATNQVVNAEWVE
jgi:hypothetical protein